MTGTEDGFSNKGRREAALGYAKVQGWRVLPCHTFEGGCTCENPDCSSPAKHPLTPNGCKDATNEAATIIDWWDQTQGLANVAVATGVESGTIVLDIDAASGGMNSLARLEQEYGAMPLTPTCQTGGGGRHYYFRYPLGTKVGNRTGVLPGIDVRGDGGYVLAPPSLHASGANYLWLLPPETPLADLPDWLRELICGPRKTPESNPPVGTASIVLKLPGPASDLHNSPGAPKGQRHDILCRLIGAHLAQGEDPESVEVAALAWAARCQPPMDRAEVVKTVRSLAAKHRSNEASSRIGFASDDVDSTPLPDPNPRPELHPDALAGLPGRIVRTLEPHTEADPVGVLLTFLACFGNAVGRGPHVGVGADSHHANLFVGLVGDTASGKGQAWGIARFLMRSAAPDWESECIGYGLSSGEGLVERVGDPQDEENQAGSVFVLPPVRRLLCYESEFAKPITAMRREGNTLSALLRAAWDSQTLEVMTRGRNKLKASNAHIGIVAHITPDELSKLLSGSVEIANGFANRFLWCHVQRSRLLPHGGDSTVLDPFAEPLADALAKARFIGRVSRDSDADRLWEGVYASLAEAKPGAFGRATERARPQVLRLALIYALLDGNSTITAGHLRSAIAVWRYCEESARMIFGQVDANAEDPLEQQILGIIRQQPGVNRKGLHKALGGHTSAAVLVNALAKLRDRRLIRAETVSTGGRPGECWWSVGVPCTEAPPPEETISSRVEGNTTDRTECNGLTNTDPNLQQGQGKRSIALIPDHELTASPPNLGVEDAGASLSLTELLAEVQRIGGKIVRSSGAFSVHGAAGGSIKPAVQAALVAHQLELDILVPPSADGSGPQEYESGETGSKDQPDGSDTPLSDEEFYKELVEM